MASSSDLTTILRQPGEGLLTVTTGSGSAARLLAPFIGRTSVSAWPALARKRMKVSGPHIVALPSDAGGGICRGAAHGPLHLRASLYARHPEFVAHDLGDIPCIPQLLDDSMLGAAQLRASGKALWGIRWTPSLPVAPLSLLKEFLIQGFAANPKTFRPFILGGDHSTSFAVTEALFEARLFPKLAILHFDAHTDLLESRYGVERCFATWAAHAVKRMRPCDRKNFVQVGVRVSGKSRDFWQKKFGLRQVWAKELVLQSAENFALALVESWKRAGCERLYISFDVDALDPKFVPSTGTAEPGGLDPKWCRRVIEICTRALPLVAADIVELAPVLGSKAEARRSTQHSARIAATLLKGIAHGL
ncbi:MAG: arginase family protein [Bdellovibrionota bacterium]